jgi:hypothetical protein
MLVEMDALELEVVRLAHAYAKAQSDWEAYAKDHEGSQDVKAKRLVDAATDAEIALVDQAKQLPVMVADSGVR